MKRGLVEAAGASRPFYEARVERLQEHLRREDLRVALIYGDVYRSDDIAHLTNLCIYWNEGVVAVPAEGAPVFLAKLSKRVHPWMERTSIIEDLRASQRLPELIGTYLGELGPGGVGFVDQAWWPAPLVDGVIAAAQGRDCADLPDVVRNLRLVPDDLDRADLDRAAKLVAVGMATAADTDGTTEERLAALELAARSGGARDVLAACREMDGRVQIDCTVQYANVWAHGARVIGIGDALRAELDAAAAALRPGVGVADVQAAVGDAAVVSVVSHCDLATRGDLRPPADRSGAWLDGEAVSLAVRLGGAVLADTYLLDGEAATVLTQSTAEVAA